jgi:hypothetical protein
VSAIKLAKARDIAGELHAKVRLGGDPAFEKREKAQRALDTFGSPLTHRMPCSGDIKGKRPISLTTPQILLLLFIAPVLLLLFCPCFTAPVPAPGLTGPPLDPAYSSLHGAVADAVRGLLTRLIS